MHDSISTTEKEITFFEQKKNKFTLYKVLFVLTVACVFGLLFFLFKDILLEILRLTKADDHDGLKQFMREKGWLGFITVPLVEAMEMVVVCIPAEFIQMPAGISFPFWIAVILCDLGVCLGASVIYFLVRVLKFDSAYIAKKEEKISTLVHEHSEQKIQILMYFLFVTPIIPFGAICYYCSSKRVSYGRYLFTCATGVIPSIVTSIAMGTGVKYFITESLPLWVLLLLIFGLGAVLFIGMFLIAKKYLFPHTEKNTPSSMWYGPIKWVLGVASKRHAKATYVKDDLYNQMQNIEGSVIILCNHLSWLDVFFTMDFIEPRHAALVYNRNFLHHPVLRWIVTTLGFIPKRMFCSEITPLKQMIRYTQKGISLMMFPEARLSCDGTTNPITNATGTFVKKLQVPVVLLGISGSYLASPKWRGTAKGKPSVQVRVNKIISPEQLQNATGEEIDNIIQTTLTHNEFEYAKNHHYKGNLAKGLGDILYRCPSCLSLYTMKGKNNLLQCSCGCTFRIDSRWQFEENEFGFSNVHDMWLWMKKQEISYVEQCDEENWLDQEVFVKKISEKGKKYDVCGEGVCTLSANGLSFSGRLNGTDLAFSHTPKSLQVLAFGVNGNYEYECYYQGDLYYFTPKQYPESSTRMSLLYDVLVEKNKQNTTS